jgi:hypothetical protein
VALSILVSGCSERTIYEKFCPDLTVDIPSLPKGQAEPVGKLDVVDKNVSSAVMYRDMSKIKDVYNHSYKTAVILDGSLFMEYYDAFGTMFNSLTLLKEKIDRDCNTTKTKDTIKINTLQ